MKLFKYLIPLVLALASCVREEVPESAAAESGEREMVPVKLYLGVAPMEYVVDGQVVDQMPTKSGDHISRTNAAENTEIYNLWILVFELKGDEYVLETQPVYISNYKELYKNPDGSFKSEPESITIPSSKYRCQVLFLANTGLANMSFTGVRTLDEFKEALSARLSTQQDLFGYVADEDIWVPRFNGTVSTVINTSINSIGSKDSPVLLKRAMAKLEIHVLNQSLIGTRDASQRIHLRYVRVNNVQDRSFYYTNYPDYATSKSLRRPSTASPLKIDTEYDWDMDTHKVADWNQIVSYSDFYNVADGTVYTGATPDIATILTGAVAPTDVLARFFLPGNVRATDVGDATSVTIVGEFTQDGVIYQCSYNIPLVETSGGQTCYAVRPNHYYVVNVTIEQRRDSDAIYNDGLIDFSHSELANCYILNPPQALDIYSSFKFPIEKANRFWGDPRYEANTTIVRSDARTPSPIGTKYGRDLVIGENDDWWVEILWADFDYRKKVEFLNLYPGVFEPGKGRGNDPDGYGCFGLRVYGGTKGNMVIALKKRLYKDGDPSKYLDFTAWSWHMWITDYNPDSTPTFSPSGRLGTVTGGKVFKVNNDFFNNGEFRNSYAMDRVIGAWNDPASEEVVSLFTGASTLTEVKNMAYPGLGLFYQYGRKDPFPGHCTVYYPDPNYPDPSADNARLVTKAVGNNPTVTKRSDILTRFNVFKDNGDALSSLYYTNQNVRYLNENVPLSVMYPLTGFMARSNSNTWTYGDKYAPDITNAPIFWNDPFFAEHEEENVTHNMGYHKSIFDPCPPGWILQPKQMMGGTKDHYFIEDMDHKTNEYFDYLVNVHSEGVGTRAFMFYPDGRPDEFTPSTYSSGILLPYLGFMQWYMNNLFSSNNFKNIYNWLGFANNAIYAYRVNFNRAKNVDTSSMNNGERSIYYQTRCLKNVRAE